MLRESLFLGLLLSFCVFCCCFALRSVLFLLLVTRCNALRVFWLLETTFAKELVITGAVYFLNSLLSW